jgi:NADPH2:quinone reductase
MRAVEITVYGAPEVLCLGDRPDPVAGAGEVLIRVKASGINRPDVLQRMGHYPVPPGASDIPGLEVAGEIIAGDAAAMSAAGFKLGDRVCALVAGGGYAELCVAPVGQCLPVPTGLSDIEAATLPETFFTVWSNVFDRARLQAGETLLIQGGTSGIGVTAIQMAKALGARVIATAGSDEKCAACIALGADHAINYKSADFSAEARNLTDGKGVNVILDMVAGSYVAREVECLAEDITGSTLRPRALDFKTAIAAALRAKVWPLIERAAIKPVIYKVFAAEDAAKAHTLMESNQHVGKIVLTW